MAGNTTTSFPPRPELGKLRLAEPSDILRIGIVTAAAFRYTPLFQWERPHHEQFPEDTLLSYRTPFKDAMQNDNCIVLVAEDLYNPNESDLTEAIIPSNDGWDSPAENTKVVVGVTSIMLEPGSKRKGQFKSHKSQREGEPVDGAASWSNVKRRLLHLACQSWTRHQLQAL